MFLYILENTRTRGFYIGITNNLNRRLDEHNSNNQHFTGKINGEWKLIFKRRFISEIEARKEEIRLKKAKNKKYIR